MKTFGILCAVNLCALSLTAGEFPTDPLQGASPEQLAKLRAPLEVVIKPVAVTEPAQPMSFVSGTNRKMLNQLSQMSGFEPMAYRTMLRPDQTSADSIELGATAIKNEWHAGLEFPEGFYDGARVRVYHPVNGKMELIRDAVVPTGGHHASGWHVLAPKTLSATGNATQCRVVFDETWRLGVPYWFMLRAVGKDGTESPDSNVVTLTPTEAGKEKAPEGPAFKAQKVAASAPVAPRNLRVTVAGGVATFAWEPTPEVAGYRLYVSAVEPAKHRGFRLKLASQQPRTDQRIQEGDLVFIDCLKTRVDQGQFRYPQYWAGGPGKPTPRGIGFYSDERPGVEWALAPHPGPVPAEFVGRGETCLKLRNDNATAAGLHLFMGGGTDQSWYDILPATEHVIEGWVRADGPGTARILFGGEYAPANLELPESKGKTKKGAFPIEPITVPLTGQWTKFRATFTPAGVPAKGLQPIWLAYTGPGTLYLDNLVIYRSSHPVGEYDPVYLRSIGESGFSLMRTHELIKTKGGYTLNGMINQAGGNNYSRSQFLEHTFHSLLTQMKKAGNISPWLQVEMCLDEQEWLGFVEWLAAPYDPAKGDTPAKKPWAYRRYQMGQQKPWLDEFPRFGFEISNETWNPLFQPWNFAMFQYIHDGANGQHYTWGATYGLFFDYVIRVLQSSPYWTPEVEKKTSFMICSWTGNIPFGADAARHCPRANQITYANYNANKGLGDPGVITDFKRFVQMQWGSNTIEPMTRRAQEMIRVLRREGSRAESGVYEFGPNYYVMPGDPRAWRETDQQLARSLTAAVYVLDAILTWSENGFQDKAFFTFGANKDAWGTHTTLLSGAHPYPKWKAMRLFNQQGAGAFLEKEIRRRPTWDFPAYETTDNMDKVKRAAAPDSPLATVYATVNGDRCTVMLLSRKLDNFPVAGDDGVTPVTVHLPFKRAAKVTLYRLAGDPRVDDREKENIKIEKIELPANQFSGQLTAQLPPSAICFYVFEGTDIGKVNHRPTATFDVKTVPAFAPVALVGQPCRFENKSTDADGDKLTAQWDFGAAGQSRESNPTVTFKDIGPQVVRLTVNDGRGGVATVEETINVVAAQGPVLLGLGVTGFGRTMDGISAKADGNRLTLRGYGQGAENLAATPHWVFGNGVWEATVVSLTGSKTKGARPARAGIFVGGQTWWVSSTEWKPLGGPGLTVASDGAVTLLRGGPDAPSLPAGSVSLPVRLRVEVRDRLVTMSVQRAGKWEKLFTDTDPVEPRMFLGLCMGSGDRNAAGMGDAVFENITWSQR